MKNTIYISLVLVAVGCNQPLQPATPPAETQQEAIRTEQGQGCIPDVQERPYVTTPESQAHKVARETRDKAKQACDEMLIKMKDTVARCKEIAATSSPLDPDQSERNTCIREEKHLTAIGNIKYDALNRSISVMNRTK